MKRALRVFASALPLVMLTVSPALADVKTRDKTQVKFEGMLGRMVGMVGAGLPGGGGTGGGGGVSMTDGG